MGFDRVERLVIWTEVFFRMSSHDNSIFYGGAILRENLIPVRSLAMMHAGCERAYFQTNSRCSCLARTSRCDLAMKPIDRKSH